MTTNENRRTRPSPPHDPVLERVSVVLESFTRWLESYGELSWDHQSFFAGPIGSRAKEFYYTKGRLLGTAAVAPMIFCEAFVPSARRLFHKPIRFPIADAHYAMGFGYRYQTAGDAKDLAKAEHFIEVLERTRCPGFKEFCWGYPFDWVTRNGTIKAQTPLITSTPYVFEAIQQIDSLGAVPHRRELLESIARHATTDIKDFPVSSTASTCSYHPDEKGGVINASAYRAFMLTAASKLLERDDYWIIAEKNLNFVLDRQNPDGSWYYAIDGVRDFVDHFHTCFVMKALAKLHSLTGHARTLEALARGVAYYQRHLFDAEGLPQPFSKAPRLTVYKRELYDCAEAINLCLLLRDRFPQLDANLGTVVRDIVTHWIKPDGSFRARMLHIGWDNVPMHRWAQSQMFRALAFYEFETSGASQKTRNHHVRNLRPA